MLPLKEVKMTRAETYNTEYTKLNHAYIQIFESYKKLLEAENADEDVTEVIAQILRAFNPVLDKIKSQMTVKTRYKDTKPQNAATENQNGALIFHPEFN